jgi:FtsZ-binding cell division protein ZapB
MKLFISKYQIDWPNHIIGFFSALFGILIAFELDEWREERNQIEIARVAFENLKKEIQINQNSLHENISNNVNYIDALQSLTGKMDNQLRFVGVRAEADSINVNFSRWYLLNGLILLGVKRTGQLYTLACITLQFPLCKPLRGSRPKLQEH